MHPLLSQKIPCMSRNWCFPLVANRKLDQHRLSTKYATSSRSSCLLIVARLQRVPWSLHRLLRSLSTLNHGKEASSKEHVKRRLRTFTMGYLCVEATQLVSWACAERDSTLLAFSSYRVFLLNMVARFRDLLLRGTTITKKMCIYYFPNEKAIHYIKKLDLAYH